jgi:hypothetical protein
MREGDAAAMLSIGAQQKPLAELEAAYEAAETLLTDHKDLLPGELAARLSSLRDDLTMIIEDNYGISPDDDEQDAMAWTPGRTDA